MAREHEIIMTASHDVSNQSIRDLAPEMIKKMYIYDIPKKSGNLDAIFVPGSTTFLGITRTHENFVDLEKDEKGIDHYTWVLPNEILQAYIKNSASTSFVGSDLDYENSMMIYIEDFFETKKGDRFLVTFDEPYDYQKFKVREQQAFIIDQGKLVTEEFTDLPEEFIESNSDGASVFTLQSLHTVIDSQAYTNIIPYFWSTELEFTDNKINLEINKELLIDKITGLREMNGIVVPLNFESSSSTIIIPWKIYPASTTGQLNVFMDWQDANVVLPWELAKQFIGKGVTLGSVIKNVDIVNLVEDMILLTYGFITGFKDIPRNDQGVFAPGETIGNAKIELSSLSGQGVLSVISGLMSAFESEFPAQVTHVNSHLVRAIIATLSKYIISGESISGGNNRFNEIFLPWFLKLTNKLKMVKKGKVWGLVETPKFKLDSKWFDLTLGGKPFLSQIGSTINLSKSTTVSTDYNYVMQDLPNVISPEDLSKAFNPGIINPKNPKEINYVLKMMFNSSNGFIAENLFKSNSTNRPAGSTEDVDDLPWLPAFFPAFDTDVIGTNKSSEIRELQRIKNNVYNYLGNGTFGFYNGDNTKVENNWYLPVKNKYTPPNVSHLEEYDYSHMPELITISNDVFLRYYKQKLAIQYNVFQSDFDLTADLSFKNFEKKVGSEITIQLGHQSYGSGTGADMIQELTAEHFKDLLPADKNIVWPQKYTMNPGAYLGEFLEKHGNDMSIPEIKLFNKYFGEIVKFDTNKKIIVIKPIYWRPKKGIITWKKTINTGISLKNDVLFSKSDWSEKLFDSNKILDSEISIKSNAGNSPSVKNLKILEIKGIWGDKMKITNSNNGFINHTEIEFPSNSDETITINRIAFL